MVTKIALIIAILAGGAALYFAHVEVDGRIKRTEEERNKKEAELSAEKADKATVQANLDSTKKKLDDTSTKLADTEKSLQTANTRATQADAAKAKAEGDTRTAKAETEQVKAQNKEFFDLKMTVVQIRKGLDDGKKAQTALDATTTENKILNRRVTQQGNEIALLKNPSNTPILPANLKGKVVAVDPKWDFVVVNVGSEHGALRNGEMLVHREGRLVGRVKLVSVESVTSIANIMPQWKKSDVLEGDLVVP
jgi:hypothetical protein